MKFYNFTVDYSNLNSTIKRDNVLFFQMLTYNKWDVNYVKTSGRLCCVQCPIHQTMGPCPCALNICPVSCYNPPSNSAKFISRKQLLRAMIYVGDKLNIFMLRTKLQLNSSRDVFKFNPPLTIPEISQRTLKTCTQKIFEFPYLNVTRPKVYRFGFIDKMQ